MKKEYSDIIGLPHHVSENRPHMAMLDRAAQFSPFAALTGYDAAVKETARLTDQRIELDDEMKQRLSERLSLLQENLAETPVVKLTYFVPDARKEGGAYRTVTSRVKRIDVLQRLVVLKDGVDIPIDEIVDVSGAMFRSLDDSYA
ncbi:MAG: YolD-like family protein [Oscillospiraceae bacterium]|nr:YolD-like family protein [Oscillospiraceae bacterium]